MQHFFAPSLVSIINVLFYWDFLPAPAPPLLLLTWPLETSHDLFRRPKKGGPAAPPPAAARETLSRTTSCRTKQKNKNGNGAPFFFFCESCLLESLTRLIDQHYTLKPPKCKSSRAPRRRDKQHDQQWNEGGGQGMGKGWGIKPKRPLPHFLGYAGLVLSV